MLKGGKHIDASQTAGPIHSFYNMNRSLKKDNVRVGDPYSQKGSTISGDKDKNDLESYLDCST